MQNKFANYIGKFKKIKNWILIVIFSILSFGFLVGTSQTENRIHSHVIQQKLLSSMVLKQSSLKQELTSHVDRQPLTMPAHDLREDSQNSDHVLANKRNNNKPWKVFGKNPIIKNYSTRLIPEDNNNRYFTNPKKRVVRNVDNNDGHSQITETVVFEDLKINKNILPSELKFPLTITNKTYGSANGFSVTFTRESYDDAAGSITIKATISKDSFKREITKTYTKFKTTKQDEQYKINSIVEGDLNWVSPDTTKLPSEIKNYDTPLTDATIKGVSGLKVEFEVHPSDATGSLTIKATITKNHFTEKKDIKIIWGIQNH